MDIYSKILVNFDQLEITTLARTPRSLPGCETAGVKVAPLVTVYVLTWV